jgi:hypothetical protein
MKMDALNDRHPYLECTLWTDGHRAVAPNVIQKARPGLFVRSEVGKLPLDNNSNVLRIARHLILISAIIFPLGFDACGGGYTAPPPPPPPPSLQVNPSSLSFGSVQVGSTSTAQTVTISNGSASSANVVISSIVPPAQFRVSGVTLPLTLTPGQQTTMNVNFVPSAAGNASGNLVLMSTASASPTDVSVAGTGTSGTGSASVSPASIDFGLQSVGVLTCPQSITVTNSGAAVITLTSASVSAPFQVSGLTAPVPVPAGHQISFGVTYSPGVASADNATLTVSFDVGSSGTVSLTGTGVQTNATGMIPLIDMGQNRTYLGFSGGLYANGCNVPPSDHDAVGRSLAAKIQPLDVNGSPSASGKIAMLSIGMSNTSFNWCGTSAPPNNDNVCTVPSNDSLMSQAQASPSVNHTTLVLLDGAAGNQSADVAWTTPTDPNYDRIRDFVLAPVGLTEKQVQSLWIALTDRHPNVALPSLSADAFTFETRLGDVVRSVKTRYPNLQIIFFGSREYGGYDINPVNPEPYAYETGYSVKWLIQAQIGQMRNGGTVVDPLAGDLNYNTVAPWLAWSAYTWANGPSPRSDALVWCNGQTGAPCNGTVDFQADGLHPSASGIKKVGTLLLDYFLGSPYSPWFRGP